MQFSSILLNIAAVASIAIAESEVCNVDLSARRQHCSVQFKSDAESRGKFVEVYEYLKSIKCSWIGANDIKVNVDAVTVESDLPVGFVDAVFSKLPQYMPYLASKNCN